MFWLLFQFVASAFFRKVWISFSKAALDVSEFDDLRVGCFRKTPLQDCCGTFVFTSWPDRMVLSPLTNSQLLSEVPKFNLFVLKKPSTTIACLAQSRRDFWCLIRFVLKCASRFREPKELNGEEFPAGQPKMAQKKRWYEHQVLNPRINILGRSKICWC